MWAKKQAPDENYKFVVFRPDWNPAIEYTEQNGTEIRRSLNVSWPSDFPLPERVPGREPTYHPTREKPNTCMLFINTRYLFDRVTKLGWVDVTELWEKGLDRKKRLAAGEELPPLGEPVGAAIPAGKAAATGRHANKEAPAPTPALPPKQEPPKKEVPPKAEPVRTAPEAPAPPPARPPVQENPAHAALSPEAQRALVLLEMDLISLENALKAEPSLVIRVTLAGERQKQKPRSGAIKLLENHLKSAVEREQPKK